MQKVEDLLSTSKQKMNLKINKLKNLKENLLKVIKMHLACLSIILKSTFILATSSNSPDGLLGT